MSLFAELLEDEKEDKKIVKTFKPKKELSPIIFNKNGSYYVMKDDIRNRLITIANDFIDTLGVEFFIHDIILTGSLANYNWSKYSDVDIHVIFDMDEFGEENKNQILLKTIFKEFFDAKKNIWNEKHDIKIKNHDVEIYAQDIHEKHVSSGVYSIMNNSWIFEPKQSEIKIDDRKILEKGSEIAKRIDEITHIKNRNKAVKAVDTFREKIKKFRKCGLEKGGEYSYENLTFKLLRRNGEIKKLIDFKHSIVDKTLTIKESPDEVIINGQTVAEFSGNDGISFGIYENQMIIGYNKNICPKNLFIKLVEKYGDDDDYKINGVNINRILYDEKSKHYENFAFYNALYELGIEKTNLYLDDLKTEYVELTRADFEYSGRFWYIEKIISFWKYPETYDKLMTILHMINVEMQKIYGMTINFEEYLIEVVDKNNNQTNNMLMPISKYKKSESASEEEMKKQHVMSPMNKIKTQQTIDTLKDKNKQMAKKEKGWNTMAQRNYILSRDIAENDS